MNYSFDNFWIDYDKKTGKDKCLTKWMLLTSEEHLKIKIHVPGFVSRNRNKQYRPNPLSYLNGKMWRDESIGDTEQAQTYKELPQPTISPYQAPEFDRATGIQHLRDKLKSNYENGTHIKDWGDVYTTILREFIEIPGEVGVRLHETEVTEASKKRKRSEPQYIGSVTANVRDARLNWMLDFWRKSGRDISLEI